MMPHFCLNPECPILPTCQRKLKPLPALATSALATSADNPESSWYYVFRFLGAYLNYRERTKATSITSVEEETKE